MYIEEIFSRGFDLIEAERTRQIVEEGWTPEHDQKLNYQKNLVLAAKAYLDPQRQYMADVTSAPDVFPWERKWWKPKMQHGLDGRISEIVKGGALILAEIDRVTKSKSRAGVTKEYIKSCYKDGRPNTKTNDVDFYLRAADELIDLYMETNQAEYLDKAAAMCAMQIDLLEFIKKTHQENKLEWL